MDNGHNDGNDDTTIKRKRGRETRMWDEDKGQRQGKRTMRDNDDGDEDDEGKKAYKLAEWKQILVTMKPPPLYGQWTDEEEEKVSTSEADSVVV